MVAGLGSPEGMTVRGLLAARGRRLPGLHRCSLGHLERSDQVHQQGGRCLLEAVGLLGVPDSCENVEEQLVVHPDHVEEADVVGQGVAAES